MSLALEPPLGGFDSGKGRSQYLEDNNAVHADVLGFVDLSPTADADEGNDLVGAESSTWTDCYVSSVERDVSILRTS